MYDWESRDECILGAPITCRLPLVVEHVERYFICQST
jgi:hypothetical protein